MSLVLQGGMRWDTHQGEIPFTDGEGFEWGPELGKRRKTTTLKFDSKTVDTNKNTWRVWIFVVANAPLGCWISGWLRGAKPFPLPLP